MPHFHSHASLNISVFLLLIGCTGCALQLSGGAVLNSSGARTVWGNGAVSVRSIPTRHFGPVFGSTAQFAPDPTDGILRLRSISANAGIILPPQRITPQFGIGIENTFAIGLGQPDQGWPGFYVGVLTENTTALLLRVLGPSEPRPQRIGALLTMDLVLAAGIGIWIAPEGSNLSPMGTGVFSLGIRLGLLSDLLAYQAPPRQP